MIELRGVSFLWLPDLSPDAPLPTCQRTVVRGRTVFDSGALTA